MIRILVIEGSADQADEISVLLKAEEYKVVIAGGGLEAMATLRCDPCQLVLTDLHVPDMDGLELVTQIHDKFPCVPVIVMTAPGDEDVAAKALQLGAVSFIPKSQLADELAELIEMQAETFEAVRDRSIALGYRASSSLHFVLPNETRMIGPVVSFLDETLSVHLGLGREDANLFQVGTALGEAVLNAVHHGNLEIESELRERDIQAYLDLAKERAQLAPYSERKVYIDVTIDRDSATFVVRDEGEGFDVSHRPDPKNPDNLTRASGRGLYLISTFMDEVRHNESGNCITMVKRFSGPATS